MKFEKTPAILQPWTEFVRATGSILNYERPCQIHHIAGRKAKQDGKQVGHLLILPLTPPQHRWVDQGHAGLDEMKLAYWGAHPDMVFGSIEDMRLHEFEMFLWEEMLIRVALEDFDDYLAAARNWTRS